MVVIPPGSYTFSGEVLTSTSDSVGNIGWEMRCMVQPQPVVLTAPAPNTGGQWKRFSIPFSVPSGCTAQSLRLKRATTERAPDIDVWYDKVNIQPAGAQR
jgi:hypothetical protein